MKKSCAFLLIFSVFSRCSPTTADSKNFHGNAAHTGLYSLDTETPGTGETPGDLKWKFRTGGKIFSSPVINKGVAFVGSEDGNCYAVHIADGKLKWSFSTKGPVSSSPAVYNDIVYFTSFDGYCYALNEGTGTEIWKFKTGGEKKVGAKGLWTMKPAGMYMEDLFDFFLSSPIIEPGSEPTVFFGSSDGNMYAVDAASGNLKWKFKTNGLIHTSPALSDGVIFFGSWDTWFYALNSRTGNEQWKFKTREQADFHLLEGIQGSATVYDGLVYFGSRDGFFYALNKNTGAMVWNYPADNSWVLTTAAIKDSTVYFGTSDSYLFLALNSKTGIKKYSVKAKGYLYSSPAIAGHTAYYGDFTGNLYALDLRSSGKICQTFSTDSRKRSAARILNEKDELDFTFSAGSQDLALYKSSVDVMNEFYTLGSIVSSPAVAGNTIYFGSADGFLYAIGLKN